MKENFESNEEKNSINFRTTLLFEPFSLSLVFGPLLRHHEDFEKYFFSQTKKR